MLSLRSAKVRHISIEQQPNGSQHHYRCLCSSPPSSSYVNFDRAQYCCLYTQIWHYEATLHWLGSSSINIVSVVDIWYLGPFSPPPPMLTPPELKTKIVDPPDYDMNSREVSVRSNQLWEFKSILVLFGQLVTKLVKPTYICVGPSQ